MIKNKVEIWGNVAVIQVVQKNKILGFVIDKEDLPAVNKHYKGKTLFASYDMKGRTGIGYAGVGHGEEIRYLHRFILGLSDTDPRNADHIDGNPLNNRKSNLRVLTPRQNSLNRRITTNTGFRYIHKLASGVYEFRFVATEEGISTRRKFPTLSEALMAREEFIRSNMYKLIDHKTAVPEFRVLL